MYILLRTDVFGIFLAAEVAGATQRSNLTLVDLELTVSLCAECIFECLS